MTPTARPRLAPPTAGLELARPLAVLDLETTGTDPATDRVLEVSVFKLLPDGGEEHRTRRVNPGVPIPAEATRVHGITAADVRDDPPFARLAAGLLRFLDGCDLCGFNLRKYDLPLLRAEFARAGRALDLTGRAVVDVRDIFLRYEPRSLAGAVRHYLGRDHAGAHSAAADTRATAEVLGAMLGRYPDLPRTPAGIQRHLLPADAADADGKLVRVGGEYRFTFGRYRGQPLAFVARENPEYLDWLLARDFTEEVKRPVREALADRRRAG